MRLLASVAAADLSFLLLGDWGGGAKMGEEAGGVTPGSTVGQRDTAVGMEKVAEALDAEFVLALGDNFYSAGITNATEAARFQSTFEEVYTGKCLKERTWYAIAGNHDHFGDVRAQLDYSDGTPGAPGRWHFPSLNYTFTKTLEDGKTAQFVMFDSVILSGMSYRDDDTGEFISADRDGPADLAQSSSQWAWIEEQLQASTADYLFTAAHYPVWSVCGHGPTADLVKSLRPLLSKYRVTAHLAGHDHCLEYILDGPVGHVVSGAGARCSYNWYAASNEGKLGAGAELKWHMAKDNSGDYDGGFAAITLGATAQIRFYGNDGTVVYTADPLQPRTQVLTV